MRANHLLKMAINRRNETTTVCSLRFRTGGGSRRSRYFKTLIGYILPELQLLVRRLPLHYPLHQFREKSLLLRAMVPWCAGGADFAGRTNC